MLYNRQFYFPLATSLSVSATQISKSTRNRFDQLSQFPMCILHECLDGLSYVLSFYMITNPLHDKPILPYIDVGFAHINRDWTNETFSQVVNKVICNGHEIEWRIHHYRLHQQHLLLHVNSQFVNDTWKGIYMQIARILIQKWVPHCWSNKYSALD